MNQDESRIIDAGDREFQVFVKPVGAACNLGCSYCYYLGNKCLRSESGSSVMSDDILEELIRQHFEASGGAEVFFSWHGGEPMLADQGFFRKAVAIQKRLTPAGCRVLNGIQTNATLIDEEWGRFFAEEGFYIGVSSDGPERFHDIHRLRPNGRGTFDDVMCGLEVLRSHNVRHEILCVVNNDNAHAPLEVYRFFKCLGVPFITFVPLVERQGQSAAGVTTRSVRPSDFGRFLSDIFDEWIANDIGRIKVQIFEEALRSAFGQEHTLCIFKPVCGAVPAVEMNGDFYSCDHFVNEDYRIGNIMNRPLTSLLDDPLQKDFGEAKKSALPRYCLDCDVLDMCNGECPKNRFISAPDGEPGLNYLCEGYRHFFNHCRPFVSEVARVWKGVLQR